MTTEQLCRIAVCSQGSGYASTVDLVLPAGMDVGQAMPSVVDLVAADPGTESRRLPWRLSRLDGSVLDESLTLQENGVRDGDLLVLAAYDSAPAATFADLSGYVVDASARMHRGNEWARRMGEAAWLWSAGVGAAALIWPTHVAQGHRAVAAAVVAVAVTMSAVLASRIGLESSATLSACLTAVAFGAVAGYLMVPGGPTPPNFFLAAAICSAVATVLLRVTACGTTTLTAITSFSLMVAVAAAGATIWPISRVALGSFLTTASLTMLAVAAKLSILVAGLSPRMPTADGPDDDDAFADPSVGNSRAMRGHAVLTGLLAGFSVAAAVGTALVVSDGHGPTAWVQNAFAGAVSAALMFRASQQRTAARTATVLFAGLLCTTAAFTSVVVSSPRYAAWLCLAAVAAGAGAFCVARIDVASRMSPLTRRALEAVDYVALAAVAPMACWMGGVFDLVRGLSLT